MHFDGGGGGGEAAFISSGDIAFSGGIPAKYEEYSYRSRYVCTILCNASNTQCAKVQKVTYLMCQ